MSRVYSMSFIINIILLLLCSSKSLTIILNALSFCLFALKSFLQRRFCIIPAPLQLLKQPFLDEFVLQLLYCPIRVLIVSYLYCNHVSSLMLFGSHLIITYYSQMSRGVREVVPIIGQRYPARSPTSNPLIIYS